MLFVLVDFWIFLMHLGLFHEKRHCYFSHIPIRFLNFENILRPICHRLKNTKKWTFFVISICVCPLTLTLAELTFAQTVPDPDSTTKKQDEVF